MFWVQFQSIRKTRVNFWNKFHWPQSRVYLSTLFLISFIIDVGKYHFYLPENKGLRNVLLIVAEVNLRLAVLFLEKSIRGWLNFQLICLWAHWWTRHRNDERSVSLRRNRFAHTLLTLQEIYSTIEYHYQNQENNSEF